jgi:hypothetical protein
MTNNMESFGAGSGRPREASAKLLSGLIANNIFIVFTVKMLVRHSNCSSKGKK